jgi:hypothetical protein
MKEIFKDKARNSKHISKARMKQTGEVFTPRELIDEMLDKLPTEVWGAGKTFLEPAAGDGNFVIAVLERKIAAGGSPTQAIQDVYAIEYMKDNVAEMKRRVLDLIGDTPEHRAIVAEHIAYANTLDPLDVSEGRCYPTWMDDCSTVGVLDI